MPPTACSSACKARNCRHAGSCCPAPWSRAGPPAAPDPLARLRRRPPRALIRARTRNALREC
ncbi:hypothetical protein CO2235_U840115 [Cupriavidus oxalaticus]|uniref:Uncharacterized protein n=1 Tax=Cupriavidus oxalaticus TaxID=96344 RepID=A0A375FT32_9BURK|nr:hypothetical protein CO2235_U840115 [Cupriavidus oxalaticus]